MGEGVERMWAELVCIGKSSLVGFVWQSGMVVAGCLMGESARVAVEVVVVVVFEAVT